jgi:RNase P subunit RPR2
MNQWTLERMDNNKGHNNDNVVIACLDCNLKRRLQNKDAFLFTKQLTITRENLHV